MATGRRRGRAIIYIALILVLILGLVFVVARFLPLGQKGPSGGTPATTKGTTVQPTPTVQAVDNIVVTTQDIRRGQELKDELLAVVPVAKDQNSTGAYFKEKKDLAGSRAKFDLKAHTPLSKDLVITAGSLSDIPSFSIPAGKVAITVPLSKLSSVAYGLQKGDHVNVIVSLLLLDLDTNFQSRLPNRSGVVIAPGPLTGEDVNSITAQLMSPTEYTITTPNSASIMGRIEIDPTMNQPVFAIASELQRPRLVSQTLIQDVLVLQLGNYTAAKPAAAGTGTGTGTGATGATGAETPQQPQQQQQQQPNPEEQPAADASLPDTVTLVVDPQEAISLNYLMLSGASLNLVLRGAGDATLKDTEAVTLQFILDQYRIPNPAKLPYGTEPRIDSFPNTVPAFPEPGVRPTPENATQ